MKPAEYYVASLEEDVTMSCEGMGQPKPTIVWKRVIANVVPKLNFCIRVFPARDDIALGVAKLAACFGYICNCNSITLLHFIRLPAFMVSYSS